MKRLADVEVAVEPRKRYAATQLLDDRGEGSQSRFLGLECLNTDTAQLLRRIAEESQQSIHDMQITRLLCILFFLTHAHLHASVVENTVSLAFYDGPGPITGYYLTVYQNEAATDSTTIVFDHDFSALTFITTNIDEASDWYLVPAGVAFTASTIATENFPILVKVNSSGFETHPIDAGLGSFYLAFNTGVGFSAPATPNRQIFGWAHFINHGDSIELVSSAISYDVPGIIVGTTTTVPEPGGVALLLMGLATISITRHRRRTASGR